jgi:hypothetical protein
MEDQKAGNGSVDSEQPKSGLRQKRGLVRVLHSLRLPQVGARKKRDDRSSFSAGAAET